MNAGPDFSDEFRDQLTDLFRWRRDVRHFRTDPVDEGLLAACLQSFSFAPSVGLSEPWRVVRIRSDAARASVLQNFETCNADALSGYSGDDATIYAKLKLSGMQDSPVQLAVFCDEATTKGRGLGAGTMPEMRRYSVVSAIMQFWLSARATGLGVGWVSILDPKQLCNDLDVPQDWHLVGYLCVGYPSEEHLTPELIRSGWEKRASDLIIEDR